MKTFEFAEPMPRDYECTTVVACQSESLPSKVWVETDESILSGLTLLWVKNGIRYFGYL